MSRAPRSGGPRACGAVDALLSDPGASWPVRSVLRAWLVRDPVDAANDAEVLATILQRRAQHLLGKPDL